MLDEETLKAQNENSLKDKTFKELLKLRKAVGSAQRKLVEKGKKHKATHQDALNVQDAKNALKSFLDEHGLRLVK